ncbi:MAG: DNA polymerase II large subunit [Candidatus Micrarchaeaceae archaeon]
MNLNEYFEILSKDFDKEYKIAKIARTKGFDPKTYIEIIPASDLAGRVEGLIGLEGLADLIRKKYSAKTRSGLAFDVVKEICTNSNYNIYNKIKRIELAVKVGTAILTEGVLVAPTEGISTIEEYKNNDGSSYISILYAGPIRGAGGTGAALSVALADCARKILGYGEYKPTKDMIERAVEEIELYHTRAARLQYKPSDDDIRSLFENCPVCIDGVPTEDIEVGVHANLTRINHEGKEVPITNRVRGGMALVSCEGIAQKAKKLVEETKNAGLDWPWLSKLIKIDLKGPSDKNDKNDKIAVFLEELVAGRPVIAYPKIEGGLRLRYGRSRFTGIAAKGFNPATMIITDSFIAVGTQLKIELPGKGCVATPVDSIEGPFVKLKTGECLRINDANTATLLKNEVQEIITLGDILITYGDFKKTNTPLQPTSYVEEYWSLQLKQKNFNEKYSNTFRDLYNISKRYDVPLHPKFLYEFNSVNNESLLILINELCISVDKNNIKNIDDINCFVLNSKECKRTLELLTVTHKVEDGKIIIEKDYAQSLLVSLGFVDKNDLIQNPLNLINEETIKKTQLEFVNSLSPIKIMKRSTFIGGRIGRPEKAKERMMKPAVSVLFPIGSYVSKDKNITKAYNVDSRKFKSSLKVNIANYKCTVCRRNIDTPYCYDCNKKAVLERNCPKCNVVTFDVICKKCNIRTNAVIEKDIALVNVINNATRRLKITKLPTVIKGVKVLSNRDKITETIEKGILRAQNGVSIFKDGTARFDATDVPITHFYPIEVEVSLQKLKELGYTKDYKGNDLISNEQLVELKHQDVILNKRGAEYLLNISKFIDQMLENLYGMEKYYNAKTVNDMIGKLVITLAPHTSCAVLGRVIGFTDAYVGFAHPYTICARRRNCDGDEDTTMLLMDALINFSKEFLPVTVGGTMDTPLILTVNVKVDEIDDEVHVMEVVENYPIELYEKSLTYSNPSEIKLKRVVDKMNTDKPAEELYFTHQSSFNAIDNSPKRTIYTQLKSMQEKVDAEFALMDKIYAINKSDAARRVITSHFIPDLIGNLHSFSKQVLRCSNCNSKYRRIPLSGKCNKDGGKLLLTISKGGIEKYLDMAINLAARYKLDPYIRQRLDLAKEEINELFIGENNETKQFNLSKFM